MRKTVLSLLLGLMTVAAPAYAEGDAKKGSKVFRKCKACHALDAGKNGAGPHLANLLGRSAGSVEGFGYSNALTASGLVWDTATLTAFLAKPRDVVPGTSMAFSGLKKPADIDNLLAYLSAP